jgi:hypothetical protein
MIKRVAGNLGLGVVLFGLGWGCTMTTGDEGSSSSSPVVSVGPSPTVIQVSQPVVAPPMARTHASPSCDLAQYFPDGNGAAGGWTTGSCSGSHNYYSWYTPTVCSLDETFDSWEGPNVPVLGTHCRAAMAGTYFTLQRGGASTFVASTSPPSRAMLPRVDGPYPYNACVCGPEIMKPDGTTTRNCYEYGYEYVICPWQRGNNLDSTFLSNHTAELNQHILGFCNPGTTALGSANPSTYGVVYAYDPKCPNCVACD